MPNMRKTFQPIATWSIAGLLTLAVTASEARAQDTEEQAPGESNSSQETEVNEDNYRRFMELRDQQVQRPNQPYAVLAPPGNLEKMEKLPEESQKHLRNELRGIILEGERWTPAEAGKEYPLVASEAAERDPRLHNMEAEAWAELVQNYHAREAEIYAAGARARTATADPAAGKSNNENGGNEPERGQQDRGQTGQAAGSAGHSGQAGASDTPAPREAGATMNALEYLQNAQTGDGARTAARNSAQDDSPGPPSGTPSAGTQQGANASDVAQESGDPSNAAEAAQLADTQSQDTRQQLAQQESQEGSPGTAQDSAESQPEQSAAMSANTAQNSENPAEQSQDSEAREEVIYRSEGVIAIRDLDKLKGVGKESDKGEEEKDEREKDGS